MSLGTEQLRLAAALAHSSLDADLEVGGPGRRWVVSYQRPAATVDPCRFRQLVLAAARGCRVGLFPVTTLRFIGALRDIGGGVFERWGDGGAERLVATFLPVDELEPLVAALPDEGGALTAHVNGDLDLGVNVVTLTAGHPAISLRLDAITHELAAACMVGELLAAAGATAR